MIYHVFYFQHIYQLVMNHLSALQRSYDKSFTNASTLIWLLYLHRNAYQLSFTVKLLVPNAHTCLPYLSLTVNRA